MSELRSVIRQTDYSFGTTRSGQARGEPQESAYKGALRMWLVLSVSNRQGLAALVFSLALIHPSA
jgi:hypothetical protein